MGIKQRLHCLRLFVVVVNKLVLVNSYRTSVYQVLFIQAFARVAQRATRLDTTAPDLP